MTTEKTRKVIDIEGKLARIEAREKQLKFQLAAIDARTKTNIRKKETRAKIILGGFLVAHVKKGEKRFKELINQAINEANERDQKALLDYKKIL